MKLKELGVPTRLVIQKTEFDFLEPVVDDFASTSVLPPADKYDRFLKMLQKKGKARIIVESDVTCDGKLCGRHVGTFVAVLLD